MIMIFLCKSQNNGFTAFFGLIIFQEFPSLNTLLGITIIISMTLYTSIYEIHQQKKKIMQKDL